MTTTPTDDLRRRELAMIHVAKVQLGMEDDAYRAMLWNVAQVHSSKDLDANGRKRVIDHMTACGFKSRRGKTAFPGRPHNVDQHPQLRKIEALLAEGKRPWSYADAMARRMFSKDRVAFCNAQEWQGLVAALVYDQQRRSATRAQASKARHDSLQSNGVPRKTKGDQHGNE